MSEHVILVSDVSRAFFEAPTIRRIAVTLPQEALEEHEYGMGLVGILQMSQYGIRDAAVSLQKEVTKLMVRLGFAQAKYNTNLYHHPRTKIAVLVHGDDFVATCLRGYIRELRKVIAGIFTVKDKIMGSKHEMGELSETRVLNRILRWTSSGWEYEADQRHAELIFRGMNLEGAKAVKTPGEDTHPGRLRNKRNI